MSSDENKRLYRRFYEEIYNREPLDRLEEFFAEDFVNHAFRAGFPPGLEGFRQRFSAFFKAFPDSQVTIEDLIAEGDKLVGRLTFRATHLGPLGELGATGKSITVTEIEMMRFADGKMVERWSAWDELDLWRQLGAIPPLQPAD